MNNTFELIGGKLTIGKESEKFKPYEVTTYDSGWTINRLLFNVIVGSNRHMLESKGGYAKTGGKVYSFSKSGTDDNGAKIKGTKLEIPWADRFKQDIVDNVAEFKKFVVDLEVYGRRYKIEKAYEKFKEGKEIAEELLELGIEDIVAELESSNKKRKEFIAESDFTEYLNKVITSGKIDNKLFRITGDIINSEYNGKFYQRLVPTRVYLAEKDVEPSSTGQLSVYFNKESLDANSLKEKGKYYINASVRCYDGNRKCEIPCPVQLVVDTTKDESSEGIKKLNGLLVSQFTVKDKSWKELGVKVKLLDGAQKTEITDDMLTDLQKELLELGAITMNDIIKEIGGDVYGEKIQEMVIVNVAKGYSKGRKDTVYIDSDFVVKAAEVKTVTTKKEEPADEDDIFSGLDDLDI